MRFGIATADITPEPPIYMIGYAARRDSADRVHDPLTLTSLVLEEGPRRAVIVTADIIYFPDDETTDELAARLASLAGCPPENVLLNASHTHGGPVIRCSFQEFSQPERRAEAEAMMDLVSRKAVEATEAALGSMREGSLRYGEGLTNLPINRRLDQDGEVVMRPNPDGPVDDRLQILALHDAAGGELVAVGLRASCHPVSVGPLHIVTADFVGSWRRLLVGTLGPGVTPFFLQGAGVGDARPRLTAAGDAWRRFAPEELDEIGRELVRESLRVLTGAGMRPLGELSLRGRVNVADAACEKRYMAKEDFAPLLRDGNPWHKVYAEKMLAGLADGRTPPDHVDFRVRTLWLNREIALVGVDMQPVSRLERKLAGALAPATAITLACLNGDKGYGLDDVEMARGGYERDNYLYRMLSGPIRPGLEKVLAEAVDRGE